MRNNPGGLVDEAEAVADEFLPSGDIYSTRHRGKIVDEVEGARRRRVRVAAGRGARERVLGELGRARGRRAAGQPARDARRRADLRQGIGADDLRSAGRRRPAADHDALLHAERSLDPGRGHPARHRDRGARPTRGPAPRSCGSATSRGTSRRRARSPSGPASKIESGRRGVERDRSRRARHGRPGQPRQGDRLPALGRLPAPREDHREKR